MSNLDDKTIARVMREIMRDRNLIGRVPAQAIPAAIADAQRQLRSGSLYDVDVMTAVIVGLENTFIRNKPAAWVA